MWTVETNAVCQKLILIFTFFQHFISKQMNFIMNDINAKFWLIRYFFLTANCANDAFLCKNLQIFVKSINTKWTLCVPYGTQGIKVLIACLHESWPNIKCYVNLRYVIKFVLDSKNMSNSLSIASNLQSSWLSPSCSLTLHVPLCQ